MAVHCCPCCHAATPRWLEGCSQFAQVDYYRCDCCAHVWTVAKDGSGRMRNVTPMPGREPDETAEPAAEDSARWLELFHR